MCLQQKNRLKNEERHALPNAQRKATQEFSQSKAVRTVAVYGERVDAKNRINL
jgi:hypothetical protein